MWRGRLPHWRAEDERYYVTFRHRRELTDVEMRIVFAHLLKAQGRKLEFLILCVLPEMTEMVFKVEKDSDGEHFELSDIVEKAKTKAGRQIIKSSGERFPPFYGESYDRIIRDDAEFEETWQRIFDSPLHLELVNDSEDWQTLFVADAPDELGSG